MKIAIASNGNQVAQHFGHCEAFTLADIKNDNVVEEKIVANPGHKPGFLPGFLHEQGVSVIIAGGMGQGAIDIFNEKGIKVIVGASGVISETIKQFLNQTLVSTDSVCTEHQHADDCGGH